MARRKCFSCTAKGGRNVTLYKDRYDHHILMEHPELIRDFGGLPSTVIQYTLEQENSEVRPGKGNAQIYVSAPLQANPPAGMQRISVVIRPESNGDGWWVVTAYGETWLDD